MLPMSLLFIQEDGLNSGFYLATPSRMRLGDGDPLAEGEALETSEGDVCICRLAFGELNVCKRRYRSP